MKVQVKVKVKDLPKLPNLSKSPNKKSLRKRLNCEFFCGCQGWGIDKKIEVAEVFDPQRAPLASLSNPSGYNLPFPLPT